MTASQPPRLATQLLQRWNRGPQCEALAGDLLEQYRRGRSSTWYWRQVVTAILVGIVHDIRHHPVVAVRAVVLGSTAALLLARFTGALHLSLLVWGATNHWFPWGTSEILRQLWVWYSLPFVAIECVGFAAAGWLLARWDREDRAAPLVLAALSQLPGAISWALYTARVLEAGIWQGWGYRMVLVFQGVCLFVVYPVCVVLGGLWARRAGDRGSNSSPLVV